MVVRLAEQTRQPSHSIVKGLQSSSPYLSAIPSINGAQVEPAYPIKQIESVDLIYTKIVEPANELIAQLEQKRKKVESIISFFLTNISVHLLSSDVKDLYAQYRVCCEEAEGSKLDELRCELELFLKERIKIFLSDVFFGSFYRSMVMIIEDDDEGIFTQVSGLENSQWLIDGQEYLNKRLNERAKELIRRLSQTKNDYIQQKAHLNGILQLILAFDESPLEAFSRLVRMAFQKNQSYSLPIIKDIANN